MKVCIVQPPYSTDFSLCDKMYQWEIEAFDKCDESMDMIVFPEAADIPCLSPGRIKAIEAHNKYAPTLLEKAADTAKRCNAVVFINALRNTETGYRNTTYAFNRNGEQVGFYYKQHLTPSETTERKLDSDYTFEFEEPEIVVIDGIRYAFLTCYDFYFYEAFAKIARYAPDVIIGCSHQRSDSHAALEMMTRFCAYNTNAYVVRSSVSMDENSDIGGASMIVSPKGEVLANLFSKVGFTCVDIDVKDKYYKPAGFGGDLAAHYEYIEAGRRPWKYRPAGSAIVRHDAIMRYPRICAHRGFNTVAPENSLPAFGSAIALGAQEIEFDIWETADGEIVSIHDDTLSRVSDGSGKVYDHTYEELLAYDFGYKFGEKFKGLKILKFEDILKKFSCHAIMNIHVKSKDNTSPLPEEYIKKIAYLIEKYDCKKYVYFMSGNDTVLKQFKAIAPDLALCVGGGNAPWAIVDRAIEMGIKRVQLFKPYFNQEMIDKAKENGIICNVFWSDNAEEAEKFIEMGIDVILTNDYLAISNALKDKLEKYPDFPKHI